MRYQFLTIIIAVLVCSSNCLGEEPNSERGETVENSSAIRLSEELIRIAHAAAMSEPLTTDAISTAVVLITEASNLSPNDESVWRAMIEVAQMADLPDLYSKAIYGLLKVTPNETTSQLARLRDAIELTNTVEQRMGVYEQLLSDGRSASLDSRVASRLALDAAYLQRQLGDVQQFARWLAESVALDPAYPEAMSLAAGFFGDESADVYQRAELLASAVLSNIRDAASQVTLAEYLMAFGDYKDAQAIYENVLGEDADNPNIISNGLLSDIAIAQWASGDSVTALDTILTRQIATNKAYREKTRESQPRMSPLELARIHAPLSPKLATVRAVIFSELDDPAQVSIAVDSAVDSILAFAQLYESQGETNSTRVIDLYLQAAWISLWLGEDSETARSNIEHVASIGMIDPTELKRLEGWMAFRNSEFQMAKTILSEIPDDPAARAGLATIALAEGNMQLAAKELLEIARGHGGTMLGVWSTNQLRKIVKGDYAIRPEVEGLQNLMGGVLNTINLFVNDPRPPIHLRVEPTQYTFGPYEPILVNISMTNNTTVPIAIAKSGPLLPLVLIQTVLEIPNVSIGSAPPIIVPIDTELSIRPRETIVIQTDLRQQWIGGVLNAFPLQGASIKLRSTINFTASEMDNRMGASVLVYNPGRLGMKDETDSIRIDGVRLNDIWLERAIESISDVTSMDDLATMVLLTWIVGEDVSIKVEEPLIPPPPGEEPEKVQEGERLELQDEAITTILTTFPSLGPLSQAWIVSTMSDDPTIEAVVGMMKEPDSAIAQIAWLIRFVVGNVPDEALDDPRLLAAQDSKIESVATTAKWTYKWVERVVTERADRQLNAPTPADLYEKSIRDTITK